MRVLFTSVSATGHIHPLIPLAQAAQARGHDVRVAVGPDNIAKIEAVGLPVVVAGMTQAQRTAEFGARFGDVLTLPPAKIPDAMFPKLFGAVTAPPMLADLRGVVEEWRPDVIVHDAAELAAPIVAAAAGIPSAAHAFGALVPRHRVESAAELVAPLWASAGLPAPPLAGLYDHLYLDIYPPSLQAADMAHVPKVQPLRPAAFDDPSADGIDGFPFPGGDGPLVYLTFGTVFNKPERLRAAVDAIATLDVRVLVTVGPQADPALMGEQPPQVRVERYVPQGRVLGACTLVVSHAGSGTFLGALNHALPQLALPQAADQFINAAALAGSGAGLALAPDEATVDAIVAASSRLLAEPSFREAAAALRDEIAAMPSPDDVVTVLERLAS